MSSVTSVSPKFPSLSEVEKIAFPGTVYAVTGERDWIYYGQATLNKRIGFLRRRDREVATLAEILGSPIMSVVNVATVERALRSGHWMTLGSADMHPDLRVPKPVVQWPVGTLIVTVHDHLSSYDTRVEDPAIQHFEIAASWDAEYHIPPRLTADFGEEPAEWHVGGTILRERRVKEERARRFPDMPWHQLPLDWVPV